MATVPQIMQIIYHFEWSEWVAAEKLSLAERTRAELKKRGKESFALYFNNKSLF